MTRTTGNAAAPDAPPAADEPKKAAAGTSPAAPGSDASQDGKRLGMPHERDQSTGQTAAEPHADMKQAKQDLDAGQVDTDLRNTGGPDDARRDELMRRER